MNQLSHAIARRRPSKEDGTPDRRFGPKRPGTPRDAASFNLADYSVSRRHVADLEAAGLACTLDADHLGRPETWSIVNPAMGDRFLVWRAGRNVIVDSYSQHLQAFQESRGYPVEPVRRRCRAIDRAWNEVRDRCCLPAADYASEAQQAAEVIARLPSWLTSAE